MWNFVIQQGLQAVWSEVISTKLTVLWITYVSQFSDGGEEQGLGILEVIGFFFSPTPDPKEHLISYFFILSSSDYYC